MTLTVINAELVKRLLPMPECIDIMAQAMRAVSAGQVSIPPRVTLPLNDGVGALLLMPGCASTLQSYGAKLISLHPGNSKLAVPVIQGFVALFDGADGRPLAIVEGAALTAIRTAAASGLATRLLAREDASSCGIFGTGVQAVTHIDAMWAVRPISEVMVWSRNADRASAFAREQAERTGLKVIAGEDPAAVAGCDLICALTASPDPVVYGDWVQEGAHVNLVGAHSVTTREADSDLIGKSRLYTDLMASCRNEGGDFMIPLQEGIIAESDILGEVGQVLAGEIEGRRAATDVTVYNSLGITAQDLYAAAHVYAQARSRGLGVQVDW